jgi:hypothetical protein
MHYKAYKIILSIKNYFLLMYVIKSQLVWK